MEIKPKILILFGLLFVLFFFSYFVCVFLSTMISVKCSFLSSIINETVSKLYILTEIGHEQKYSASRKYGTIISSLY